MFFGRYVPFCRIGEMGGVSVSGAPGRAGRTAQREPPGQIGCGLRWRQRHIPRKHVPGRRGMAGGLHRRAVGAPECQAQVQGARQPAARDGPCRGAMPWGGQQVLSCGTRACGRNRSRQRDAGGCRGMQAARVLFRTKIFLAKVLAQRAGRGSCRPPVRLVCQRKEGRRAACCCGMAARGRAWGRTRGSIGAQRIRPCRNGFSGHGRPWGTHGRAAG